MADTASDYPPPDDLLCDDPRITADTLRYLPETPDADATLLIGVVHDHPASQYRAATMTARFSPDILAVELPELAVPLFEQYAAHDQTPPPDGGEMSAAIQAAADAAVVGIDGIDTVFARQLGRALVQHRAALSPTVARRLLRGVGTVLAQAGRCRGASLARLLGLEVDVDAATRFAATHDCDRTASPGTQAADEADQIARSLAVHDAFVPPPAVRIREAARDRAMAVRLRRLQTQGRVVAVVGQAHLDAVVDHVTGAAE